MYWKIIILFLLSTSVIYAQSISNVSIGNVSIASKSRIVCLGDSITFGANDADGWGYRDHLQDLLGPGVYEFRGQLNDPTGSLNGYYNNHEGYSGYTTGQILALLSNILLRDIPLPSATNSKILIHLGTNNITGDQAASVSELVTIINTIHSYDPSIEIYVALIIPNRFAPFIPLVISYNGLLLTSLNTLQSSISNLYIVDQFSAMTDNCSPLSACYGGNNTHPDDTGYQVMANAWNSCIRNHNAHYCNGN